MKYRKIVGHFILYASVLSVLLLITSAVIHFSPALYLWFIILLAIFYLPLAFVSAAIPRKSFANDEKEKIIIGNDIAHFRETVKKAKNGNPVAQREIEMKIVNMVIVDMSIKHGLSEKLLRFKIGDEKFMENYMGEVGDIIAKFYNRRYELKKSVPGEEFEREVNKVLEEIK